MEQQRLNMLIIPEGYEERTSEQGAERRPLDSLRHGERLPKREAHVARR